jgi:hypothetical protein
MAPSRVHIGLQILAMVALASNRMTNVSGRERCNWIAIFAPLVDRLTTVQLNTGEPSQKSIEAGQLTSVRGAGLGECGAGGNDSAAILDCCARWAMSVPHCCSLDRDAVAVTLLTHDDHVTGITLVHRKIRAAGLLKMP